MYLNESQGPPPTIQFFCRKKSKVLRLSFKTVACDDPFISAVVSIFHHAATAVRVTWRTFGPERRGPPRRRQKVRSPALEEGGGITSSMGPRTTGASSVAGSCANPASIWIRNACLFASGGQGSCPAAVAGREVSTSA